MNIKLKKAFSLVELLIVLAIISIVTVMFITISKDGLEKAYNIYYYASYKAIEDAVRYSNERSASVDTIDYYWVANALGFSKNASGQAIAEKTTSGQITLGPTRNGVTYLIKKSSNNYNVEVTIPSSNGNVTVYLYYLPDANYGILVPGKAVSPSGTINLYDQKDLLPFYIDDGIKGRDTQYLTVNGSKITVNTNSNWNSNLREYKSFKNAYCSKKDVDANVATLIGGSCSGGNKVGTIRVANPQKVL